jgi:hypothetical protein
MKQSFFKSILFISCLFVIGACTKKNGENQGIVESNYRPFDLMTTKSGSWWLYAAADGAVFYRYATGTEAKVDGITYSYFYRIDTTSSDRDHIPEYYGKNLDRYISLVDVDGSQTSYIRYIILKDSWFVGQKWTNTESQKIQGWNLDMVIESEVKSTNDSLTYNGNTYYDVVHVYNDLKAKSVVMPAYVNCGKLEVWFKKGVGIIREKGDFNIVGLVSKTYEDWILDYHIEP